MNQEAGSTGSDIPGCFWGEHLFPRNSCVHKEKGSQNTSGFLLPTRSHLYMDGVEFIWLVSSGIEHVWLNLAHLNFVIFSGLPALRKGISGLFSPASIIRATYACVKYLARGEGLILNQIWY